MSTGSPIRRRSTYVLAGITALLLWGFWGIADEVLEGDTLHFDQFILSFFRDPGSPNDPIGPTWVEEAIRDITGLGSFTILGIVTFAVVIYLAMSGKRRTAAFVGLCIAGGALLSTVLKLVFDRPRPDVEAAARVFSASFPSGHATVSAVVYLTLGLLLAEASTQRRLKAYFIALGAFMAILVGISRIYLGVHYPTDVVAGWSLGAAWALACWVAYAVLFEKNGQPPPADRD